MPKGEVRFISRTKDGGTGVGYIKPDDKSQNVRFSAKVGRIFKVRKGDRVEFEYGNFRPNNRGPTANFMTVINDDDDDDKIETIHGEFETS